MIRSQAASVAAHRRTPTCQRAESEIGHLKFKLPTRGPRRRRLKSQRTRLTSPGDPEAEPPPDVQRPGPLHDASWQLPSFSEMLAFIAIDRKAHV